MYQLLQKTMISAAFAGMVLLLCRLLRGKVHKRVLTLMQCLTLAVLIFPFKINVNSFGMITGWMTAKRDEQNLAILDSIMESSAAAPVSDATPIPRTFTPADNFSLPLLLWAIGIGVFAIYFVFSYAFLRHWLRKSAQPVQMELGNWRGKLDRRVIATYSMAHIRSPFTFGLLHPCIILPDWCLTLSETERRMMLEHELDHVRHFDVVKKALAACACCVFWFNPLVWLLRAQMNSTVEMACDEAATRQGKRREYALLLLQVATRPKARLSAAFSEGNIKSRVKNLAKAAGKSIALDLAVVLLVGLSFTCYAAAGQIDPTQLGKQILVSVEVAEGETPPPGKIIAPGTKTLFFGFCGYHVLGGSEIVFYSTLTGGWTKKSGQEIIVSANITPTFTEGQNLIVYLVDETHSNTTEAFNAVVKDKIDVKIPIVNTGRYRIAIFCDSSDPVAVNFVHIT